MRLISSIISQEKKENNRFFLRFPGRTGKNFPLRLFTNRARSAIIHPLKRACASGSMDRASDSGSEGWGFESLLAYQKSAAPRGGAFLVCRKGLEKGVKKTCRWHVFSPRESPSPISDASRPGMWMESEPFDRPIPQIGQGSVEWYGVRPLREVRGAVCLTGHGMKPPLRGTMCFNRPPQGSHFYIFPRNASRRSRAVWSWGSL